MRRTGLRIVLGVWALVLAGQPALADKRVALVVGNSAYSFAPLSNPLNDASDIAAALRRLRFDVMERNDLAEAKFDTALDEFEGKAKDADVALFFFSGHGVRVDKSGYLVPVGFEPASEGSALRRLIGIQETVERIEKAARVSVFVLDACRDSPLPEQLRRGGKSKGFGADKGLPLLSELGSNTFIVYATVPGETASDGTGRNSPFTAALLRHLETPGLEIQTMFTRVTADVVRETGRRQQPERLSRLQHELVLLPAGPGVQPPAAPLSADAQAWSLVQNSRSEAVLEEYARRFPDSVYAGFAKARVEELRRGKSGASWWPWGGSPQPEPSKPAEQQAAAVAPQAPPAPPKPMAQQTAVVAPKMQPAIPPEPECDGLLVSVAAGDNPCIKPGSGKSFRDCPDCPEMVIVPAGSFTMGSPLDEKERYDDEGPQHKVTISKPFAAGKFVVTFDEWDACVSGGGCKGNPSPGDQGWGKGRRPVIHVKWDDAQEYVNWLSRKTRKKYRLLSEAEWEYAARAGTRTRYFWGDSLGRNNANCNDCGSEWDNKQTAEVGQFQPNGFGLYDMAGNVCQRTDDCWNGNYNSAPDDGSARTTGDCGRRVLRGGSWADSPRFPRAAARDGALWDSIRGGFIGFRVARTF